ncbi:hypothetical protein FF011L_47190 [Roseimaritima multifibrata]|uniref:Uncharacterized protein n=1 Tax=Roseimaritima multifibrata TaxID=1930274 RepID=A0A517MLZ5_9BACT|nr:hypothetical protein [Roseimaritima multifibrata]QDS95918.1 hypothetical protein FF011L_47190 [Roseimaritima multifibrata]
MNDSLLAYIPDDDGYTETKTIRKVSGIHEERKLSARSSSRVLNICVRPLLFGAFAMMLNHTFREFFLEAAIESLRAVLPSPPPRRWNGKHTSILDRCIVIANYLEQEKEKDSWITPVAEDLEKLIADIKEIPGADHWLVLAEHALACFDNARVVMDDIAERLEDRQPRMLNHVPNADIAVEVVAQLAVRVDPATRKVVQVIGIVESIPCYWPESDNVIGIPLCINLNGCLDNKEAEGICIHSDAYVSEWECDTAEMEAAMAGADDDNEAEWFKHAYSNPFTVFDVDRLEPAYVPA